MNELENAVEMMNDMPADDAQEVTVDELVETLTAAETETNETAEHEGDGGPETKDQQQGEPEDNKDKFGRRIASALANQKRGFQKDLDFSARVRGAAGDLNDEEIANALRAYRAQKISSADSDISPKAAQKIVEAQEKAAASQIDERKARITEQLNMLIEDGWTTGEMQAFCSDAEVARQVNSGVSIRRAAKAYLQRVSGEAESGGTTHKRGVPTARTAGSGRVTGENPIENMTDEEFARFSDRAQKMMMEGKQVRI